MSWPTDCDADAQVRERGEEDGPQGAFRDGRRWILIHLKTEGHGWHLGVHSLPVICNLFKALINSESMVSSCAFVLECYWLISEISDKWLNDYWRGGSIVGSVGSVISDPGQYLEVSRYVDPWQNTDGRGEEDGKHREEAVAVCVFRH